MHNYKTESFFLYESICMFEPSKQFSVQTSGLLSIRNLLTAVLALIKCRAMADFLIKSYFPKRRLTPVVFFFHPFPTSILIYYVKPALKITGTQDGAIETGPRQQEMFPLQNGCMILLTIIYFFGFVKIIIIIKNVVSFSFLLSFFGFLLV